MRGAAGRCRALGSGKLLAPPCNCSLYDVEGTKPTLHLPSLPLFSFLPRRIFSLQPGSPTARARLPVTHAAQHRPHLAGHRAPHLQERARRAPRRCEGHPPAQGAPSLSGASVAEPQMQLLAARQRRASACSAVLGMAGQVAQLSWQGLARLHVLYADLNHFALFFSCTCASVYHHLAPSLHACFCTAVPSQGCAHPPAWILCTQPTCCVSSQHVRPSPSFIPPDLALHLISSPDFCAIMFLATLWHLSGVLHLSVHSSRLIQRPFVAVSGSSTKQKVGRGCTSKNLE